jgi:hypothetical protein
VGKEITSLTDATLRKCALVRSKPGSNTGSFLQLQCAVQEGKKTQTATSTLNVISFNETMDTKCNLSSSSCGLEILFLHFRK